MVCVRSGRARLTIQRDTYRIQLNYAQKVVYPTQTFVPIRAWMKLSVESIFLITLFAEFETSIIIS